jgi:hypothetical protein
LKQAFGVLGKIRTLFPQRTAYICVPNALNGPITVEGGIFYMRQTLAVALLPETL